jgi:hypothetical protein
MEYHERRRREGMKVTGKSPSSQITTTEKRAHSATAYTVELVCVAGINGIIEASTTLSP